MKRKTKILIALLLLCTFSLLFATVSFASEDVGDASYSETARENVFATVFAGIKEYATEIFCAMTFVGSLLLAYAYKKGLLPLVESTLVSIGNAVTRIKEKTEEGEEISTQATVAINERLDTAQRLITTLAERIDEMTTELGEVKNSELLKNRENQNLSLIVSTQIDMLYDIFITSSLPQYQKDAVGERVARMKEALAQNEYKQ